MCGISVIVDLGRRRRQHPKAAEIPKARADIAQELDDSLEVIEHRGPDSRGQWISPDGHVGKQISLFNLLSLRVSGPFNPHH